MATVIEFLGAPGTGKSALAAAVAAVRGGSEDWDPLLASDLALTVRFARADRPRHVRIGRVGLAGRVIHRLRSRTLQPDERRAALLACETDWAPFLGRCVVAETTDPLYRLYGTAWLVASLELRALAGAAAPAQTVLLDEGLLQRTRAILGPAPSDAELDELLAVLPRPAAVVHLVADIADIGGRLDARGRQAGPTLRHRGLDRAERLDVVAADARLFERVAARVQALDVPLLRVDTSRAPLEETAAHVRTWLLGVGR